MTTADEKMRKEFEAWAKNEWGPNAERHTSRCCGEWYAWQSAAAQYSERIKELEQQNEQLQAQVGMLRCAVEQDAKTYKIPLTAKLCEAIAATTQTAEAYKRRIQANGIDYVLSKMKFGEITSDELRRMASELKGE